MTRYFALRLRGIPGAPVYSLSAFVTELFYESSAYSAHTWVLFLRNLNYYSVFNRNCLNLLSSFIPTEPGKFGETLCERCVLRDKYSSRTFRNQTQWLDDFIVQIISTGPICQYYCFWARWGKAMSLFIPEQTFENINRASG